MGRKIKFRCFKERIDVEEEVDKIIDYGNGRFGAQSVHKKCGTKLFKFLNKVDANKLIAEGVKCEKQQPKKKK